MLTLRDMKRRRAELIAECRQIINKAGDESRDLNAAENRAFDGKMAEVKRLALEIEDQESGFNAPQRSAFTSDAAYIEALERHLETPSSEPTLPDPDSGKRSRTALPEGTIVFEDSEGRQVRSYRYNEPMAGAFREALPDGIKAGDLSLGRYVRGLITGDWGNAQAEQRVAMTTLSDVLGGYMVPGALSGNLIDMSRAQSVLLRAGALSIPMTTKELTLAKLVAGPSVGWKHENATFPEDTQTNFGACTLRSKLCMGMVRVAIELIQDAQNFSEAIESALSSALALELDRVGLFGSGANDEPLGLYTDPDLSQVDLNNEFFDYDAVLDAIGLIENENAVPTAWITSPSVKNWIAKSKDGEGLYLPMPPDVQALKRLVSTQISNTLGAGSNRSAAFVGGWNNLVLGNRQNITLEIGREAAGAFEKHQVLIKATLRGDWVTTRPAQLVRIINAKYTP
jgi:HK97 family phage major capsid protein